MEYHPLPALKRDLSRLVLGSMVFHLDALDLTYAMMDAWMEMGGNIIDSGAQHLCAGRGRSPLLQFMTNRDRRALHLSLCEAEQRETAGPTGEREDCFGAWATPARNGGDQL